MKKYSLIFMLCLMFSATFAQNAVTTMTGSADTLTDTEVDYVTITPTIYYEQVSFQAKVTKISGTVAGYAYLQASNDNTNFSTISDSLTLTNVTTNTKIFVVSGNQFMYYRLKFEGSGTMAAKIYGYCLPNGGNGKRAVSNMTQAYGSTSDTIANSATGYVGLTVSNYYREVSVEVVVTKISGTVGGTVTLQGSNDATNYVTVSTSYSDAQTHTATDVATSSKLFTITGSPYKYYRLSYTGTGTMSATIKGYLVPNR
jgi:hypothetical protein